MTITVETVSIQTYHIDRKAVTLLDYFNHIRRMQEIIDKMNLPAQHIQKQMDMVNKMNLPFKRIQDQLSLINGINNSSTTKLQETFASILPVFETFKKNQELSARFLDMTSANVIEMHSTISKVIAQSNSFNTLIPENLYSHLNDLTTKLYDAFPKEDHSDLHATLTVRKGEHIKERKLTWYEFATLLSVIFQIILMLCTAQVETLQHEELMIETRKQTDIHEQELRISEQKLEIDTQRLELDKKLLDQQREFIEEFNEFIEFIEPLIPDDPEDDDKNLESAD